MIEEKLKKVSSLLDPLIKDYINGTDELYKAALHLPSHGGKRLRPFLVMKSCEIVGGDINYVIPAAIAIEVLHNFTLIHDDIMDNDLLRRGVPTVHTIWGIPMAILAGDLLFAKAFHILLSMKGDYEKIVKVAEILAKTTITISEGQSMDMSFERKNNVSEEEYMTMIYKKTGALFEASAKIGAILGGGSEEMVEALGNYGKNLGIGFQIFDDYLGLISKEEILGKPIGSDIREGKKTLFVIKLLNSSLRDKVISILGKKNVSNEDITLILNYIRNEKIDEYVLNKAKFHIDLAISSLSIFPNSEAKNDLIELARYVISRVK
ncbi:MAG: polyprenyl synthetase family protein [Candidatus Verstraetearchaeota archaeon]|nr:polyprenyl synthetase family protein [Candidatus Verstraetearchaeota archaeon]